MHNSIHVMYACTVYSDIQCVIAYYRAIHCIHYTLCIHTRYVKYAYKIAPIVGSTEYRRSEYIYNAI